MLGTQTTYKVHAQRANENLIAQLSIAGDRELFCYFFNG